VRIFQEDILPLIEVDWISEQDHHSGVMAMLTSGRNKLSVVDCVSFGTMRSKGVRTAFCFDAHFRGQGFLVRQ
jgi:predicted nucleic acid-binding protein